MFVRLLALLTLGAAGFVLSGSAPSTSMAADPKREGKNLLPNGDFEKGTRTPDHWQTVDGLTTFWVTDPDPKRGKCIKFDTDVLQSQGYEWWSKFAIAESQQAVLRLWGYPWWADLIPQPDPKQAPRKLPTTPPKYDTIAAFDGVWFWSDYVEIEKEKSYWLSLDAKGAGMMVWLVGYPEKYPVAFGSEAKALQGYIREQTLPKNEPMKRGHSAIIARYIYRGQLMIPPSSDWQTFSRREKPFRPTAVTPTVRYVRVLVLPFWPPGEYYLDNVRLVEIPDPNYPASRDE